jgi:hypothetical protein
MVAAAMIQAAAPAVGEPEKRNVSLLGTGGRKWATIWAITKKNG